MSLTNDAVKVFKNTIFFVTHRHDLKDNSPLLIDPPELSPSVAMMDEGLLAVARDSADIGSPWDPVDTTQIRRGSKSPTRSLSISRSSGMLSRPMERARATVCTPVRGWGDTLVMRPSTLMAGGKSAVMNRSLPLRLTISFSRSLMNLLA